jgi:uncharacterized protein
MHLRRELLTVLIWILITSSTACAGWLEDAERAEARKDYQKKIEIVRAQAEEGDTRAQILLATMYHAGRGIQQDYRLAAKWYKLAAEQGDLSAQKGIADMYFKGLGVPQNFATAFKWYELAAAQGDIPSQIDLATKYKNGAGIGKDYVKAHMWLNIAAMDGNKAAQDDRDWLATKMPPDQVARAQELASKCVDQNLKDCGTETLIQHH